MSEDLLQQREKDLERLKKFRLMDDDFMSKVFDQNIEATQLVLNIILQRTDLKVISVQAQREFKTVLGHSFRFDVFAEDTNGKPYDIEIQRSDVGATPQRARYNHSVLDTYLLQKSEKYSNMTEAYVIFITENDVLQKGLPLYHIERKILETDELFDDGSHIIFVNGQYRNNSNDIGKLMHDFRCTESKDMNYPVLAKKVNYFKNTKGGGNAMCKMMEDMRKEAAEEAANEKAIEITLKMLKNKYPIEEISECSGLSIPEIEKLKEENNL